MTETNSTGPADDRPNIKLRVYDDPDTAPDCGVARFSLNGVGMKLTVWTPEEWSCMPEFPRPAHSLMGNGLRYMIQLIDES